MEQWLYAMLVSLGELGWKQDGAVIIFPHIIGNIMKNISSLLKNISGLLVAK